MVDILFLAKGRKEFTEASWKALLENTPSPAHRIWIFTDGDDKAFTTLAPQGGPWALIGDQFGGPVACMNAFLEGSDLRQLAHPSSEFIAKIDNDTIVPPGWLPACLDVMKRYPEVDLLGLEPWAPDEKLWPKWVRPMAEAGDIDDIRERECRKVSHVGGIGVFRRSAFERFGKPVPNSADGRFGFTEWQWAHKDMVKTFLDPPLPVFLLDHLPFPPWINLSMQYEQMGVQRRQWGFYDPIKHKALWDWWLTPSKGGPEK